MRRHSDDSRALTLDEIFSRRDERATEPVPPRTDVHEYTFESSTEVVPSCVPDEARVRIRATGDLVAVGPRAREGRRLSVDDLMPVSKNETPQGFRPPWLDIMTMPRIRPRRHYLLHKPSDMRFLSYTLESTGTDWPWSTIGKLLVSQPGQPTMVGSGVLVGPRLLLTASHAMPWNTDGSAVIRFVPGYRNGIDPRFGEAYVDTWRGVVNEDDVTGLDYVICRLNWRIGDRTGWLGSWWSSDEKFYYDGHWISVGYPVASPSGGERPSIEIPISVEDIDNESDGLEIETDKFALGGWSGGPLWGWRFDQPRVVGIESGFEKDVFDPERSVFAGGQHLVNLVKYGWDNWS